VQIGDFPEAPGYWCEEMAPHHFVRQPGNGGLCSRLLAIETGDFACEPYEFCLPVMLLLLLFRLQTANRQLQALSRGLALLGFSLRA
jgi:hypothetical protein